MKQQSKGVNIIDALNRMIEEIELGLFSMGSSEDFVLKCLIHLVGDAHQPLHMENGKDKGGNTLIVRFFGKKTTLHQVLDSEIVNHQKYSYKEYGDWINHPTNDQLIKWQSTHYIDIG